jgi:putative tryptophan/tyrosine transport system substrate-binding protein
MRRRELITLLGGAAAAWPLVTRAQQQERTRRIGVLMGWPESDPEARSERAAFVEELQKLGWVEGRNLRTDTRWANPSDPEGVDLILFDVQRFADQPPVVGYLFEEFLV